VLEDELRLRVWNEGEIDSEVHFQRELGHEDIVGNPHIIHQMLHLDVADSDEIPTTVRGDLARDEVTVPWKAKLIEVRVGQRQDGGMGLIASFIVAPDEARCWRIERVPEEAWEVDL